MPANLPPQYYELERQFRAETDPKERLRMAEELFRMMPKHKGTDRLQGEMKAKISQLKKEVAAHAREKGTGHAQAHDTIPREGAGQIIMVGAPNAGKSSLLDALTDSHPHIADFPGTTRDPQAGMVRYENCQMQLIDLPPVSPVQYEGYMGGLIRHADLVLVVLDVAGADPAAGFRGLSTFLTEKRIRFTAADHDEVDENGIICKRAMVALHKCEEVSEKTVTETTATLSPRLVTVATSVLLDESMERLRGALFRQLRIIRVYTKPPHKEADMESPTILPVGARVIDAALSVHRDFEQHLKYTRIWREGLPEGLRVNREEPVHDGDILEFHRS